MDSLVRIKQIAEQVDKALDSYLPSATFSPATLHEAMRYSIFAGGKRMRPVLCILAAEACGGSLEQAMPAACATEVLHTYTLIHDDLPCMDDDDMRRGKPTSHKVYGEGVAVLAGDALLTESFSILAKTKPTSHYSLDQFIVELADGGGSKKLIGGQVLDLQGEERALNLEELRAIHIGKTAALLTSSVRLGAMSANASLEELDAITQFGFNLGLAFQVIDDILDITASSDTLGKTAGKDMQAHKATYPALLGLDKARQEAQDLTSAALHALQTFSPERRKPLEEIAQYLLNRNY